MDEPDHGVPFGDAARFWVRLGFINFGGPAGQIALMHEEIVEQRGWVSNGRFLHALNFCMLLPGPEAQQLAIYVGWLLHRVRGGLIAGVIFALAAIAGATAGMAEEAGPLASVLFGVGAIIFLPILYAVMGAVAALLIAGLYNLAAGLTGGVELELR